jgi:peptidyl-prolyl cis-trans isomerase D
MLRNFRSVFKGNQMPMAVIMMVVLLGMVAYLAPSHGSPDAPDNVLARVYGRDIMRRDLDVQMSELARRLGKNVNLETMGPFLRTQALSMLVRNRLQAELAERHGVVVTDGEIKLAMESFLRQRGFVGDDNQLMPTAQINDALRERGMSLRQLEETITGDLSRQKLAQQAAVLVPVDAPWVDLENRVRSEKISFEAVQITPDAAPVADPGQPTLEAFLKASGARFQTGPRRVIDYVALTPAALALPAADDAAVKAVYDGHKAQYAETRASLILFKAESDAEVEAAMAKATALRAKLVAGQDFNQTAQAVSEDPTAKSNKGELGWFQSGQMQRPFEDAAKALKVGEISQPVRTSFGVHLIKLEGLRDRSFDQVKEELRTQMNRERFATKAKDKLEQLRKRAGDRGDLNAAARNLGLKIQTSQPFAAEDAVDGLPGSQAIVSEAFRLPLSQVSRVRPVQDGFVVFRVREERPIAVPPLAEIQAKVLAAWKLEEARRTATAKAQAAIKGGDLKALGTPTAQDAVTIASLGELGKHPAIRTALLNTAVGQLTAPIWTPDGKLWVARIKARTPADPLTFGSRRALIEAIQMDVAQKQLTAELQDLERNGDLHPGFSSFYGRYNGIWRNLETSSGNGAGQEDFSGLDD